MNCVGEINPASGEGLPAQFYQCASPTAWDLTSRLVPKQGRLGMPLAVSNRKLKSYRICASAIYLSYIARILEVSGSSLVSASLQCHIAEGEFPNPFCHSCTVWICRLQLQHHILTKSHPTKWGKGPTGRESSSKMLLCHFLGKKMFLWALPADLLFHPPEVGHMPTPIPLSGRG